MFENKNILFLGFGNKEWIGGLYYVKNIIYTLHKENKLNNSSIYLLVKVENIAVYSDLISCCDINIITYKDKIFNKIIKKISEKIFRVQTNLEIISIVKKLEIDLIYPVGNSGYAFLKNKCIHWIPDFQHIHLKKMFSKKIIHQRNKLYKYISENHKYLILSSYDSLNDYKNLYPENTDNVFVQHFKSFISNDYFEILNKNFVKSIILKYELKKRFYLIPNQFWQHKNHITVFKAVKYIKEFLHKKIYVVCTGNTKDFRNRSYFNLLMKYIDENKLMDDIKILGFIDRKDQLALIKESIAVIQPSLFEGWSTVVEDAKVFDKKIFLSNINVNIEQKNKNSIIFKKEDYVDLAYKLIGNKN